MTEEKLIETIKQLKEIKPRKEWAVLLKSQILAEKQVASVKAQSVSFTNVFSAVFASRKLVYSFAAIALLVVGAFGLMKLYPVGDVGRQAALTQNVAEINTKIAELTKDLNPDSFKDVASAKKVADGVQAIKKLQTKTFADMQGTPEEKSLSNAITSVDKTLAPLVRNEMSDLQNTTLTDAQKEILKSAQDLYSRGKYAEALEEIMTINK